MRKYILVLLFFMPIQGFSQVWPENKELSQQFITDANLDELRESFAAIKKRIDKGDGVRFCANNRSKASMRIFADFESRVIQLDLSMNEEKGLPLHSGYIELARPFEVTKEMVNTLPRYGISYTSFFDEGYFVRFISKDVDGLIYTNMYMIYPANGQDTVIVLNDNKYHTYFSGAISYCR